MGDESPAQEWFSIAVQDLALAEHAYQNMRPSPDELICFHCQQSAEKDLKGFLVFHNWVPFVSNTFGINLNLFVFLFTLKDTRSDVSLTG